VNRSVARVRVIAPFTPTPCRAFPSIPTREGFRGIRQSGDFARCRIIAGFDVTLPYRFPVACITPPTNSESALPIPTPWKYGRQTVRCTRHIDTRPGECRTEAKATGRPRQNAQKHFADLWRCVSR
jgi:hypothetical protein